MTRADHKQEGVLGNTARNKVDRNVEQREFTEQSDFSAS